MSRLTRSDANVRRGTDTYKLAVKVRASVDAGTRLRCWGMESIEPSIIHHELDTARMNVKRLIRPTLIRKVVPCNEDCTLCHHTVHECAARHRVKLAQVKTRVLISS